MNPRRRRLTEGTEVLWFTVTYALVFMLPVASLTFDFQVWIIVLQFGALIFIDNWMSTHRKPRIKALVDHALSVN